jgi:hypothetical protein
MFRTGPDERIREMKHGASARRSKNCCPDDASACVASVARGQAVDQEVVYFLREILALGCVLGLREVRLNMHIPMRKRWITHSNLPEPTTVFESANNLPA